MHPYDLDRMNRFLFFLLLSFSSFPRPHHHSITTQPPHHLQGRTKKEKCVHPDGDDNIKLFLILSHPILFILFLIFITTSSPPALPNRRSRNIPLIIFHRNKLSYIRK